MPRAKKFTVTLDDDPMMPKIIEKATGLPTVAFPSRKALLEKVSTLSPSAAFVDLHLGEDSGLDLIPLLREKWFYCPILVITGDPGDEVVGQALAAGADDFVMKPLRPGELLARLQARWHDHAQREAKNVIRLSDVMLDGTYRKLRGKKKERHLSETEVNLLRCLWSAEGTIVSREALKWQGWGEKAVSDANLDRKLHDLREILNETSEHLTIENSYGEGFALKIDGPENRRKPMKATTQLRGRKSEPLFNEEKLKDLSDPSRGGSWDFFQEIADIFLTDSEPLARDLEAAIAKKDSSRVRQYAHKLKGMCFNMGTDRLAALCGEIEEISAAGKVEGTAEIFRKLRTLYSEVREALQAKVKQAA